MLSATTTVTTLSYAAVAAAFLFLFALLMTSWRGRLQGLVLSGACLGSAIWAALLAYSANRAFGVSISAALSEILRNALWFAFLMVLLGYSREALRAYRALAFLGIFGCLSAAVLTIYHGGLSPADSAMPDILARLVLAVIGVVLVEQLYRNVDSEQRWGIKYLCLGLGGLFVCDFYLYSDALLFHKVNGDIWAARGVINLLVVPFIAISVARNPRWSIDISISRRMVFYSTTVLGAAIYLMVMAGAGYYIRYFGRDWGVMLQLTFWFGALLLLMVALFSGTMRARLKVFLSKNFFSYYYDYREEWLRFTRTLSEGEPGTQVRERSIDAIAQLVASPGGLLWLAQDREMLVPAARWNMPSVTEALPMESPLAHVLEKNEWVIDLQKGDSQLQPFGAIRIPEWLVSIPNAWLMVPLIHHEALLGFVVLARSKARIELNWEVIDLLRTAGRQAASYLAQLEAAQALIVARQFESFNRMSAFVVHDLKNIVAQLSLLAANAHKHKHKPEFQDDMIQTITNSVQKMERLLFQLRGNYSLDRPAPVEINTLLRNVVSGKSGSRPKPELSFATDEILSVVAHEVRLDRVIGHLVQNAIEATPDDGHVRVRLSRRESFAIVEIVDSGSGMSEQFIASRLFKPFESTKTTGMGIGSYETRQYVREIGGKIDVKSKEGEGTTFQVTLPLFIDKTGVTAEIVKEVVG